jgi:hypothetical protein
MTKLLKQILEQASRLPDEEQDSLAAILMEEMADEARWAKAFEESQGALEKLAQEALDEFRRGETTPLEFDKKWCGGVRRGSFGPASTRCHWKFSNKRKKTTNTGKPIRTIRPLSLNVSVRNCRSTPYA